VNVAPPEEESTATTPEVPPSGTTPATILGLIGPRSSGKTQLKVYLLGEHADAPRYLAELYRVPAHRTANERDQHLQKDRQAPTLATFDFSGGGTPRQQVYHPTKAETNTKALAVLRVQYAEAKGQPLRWNVDVIDFAGEAFTTTATPPSTEWELAQQTFATFYEQLARTDHLILVVPFWHLLPERAANALGHSQFATRTFGGHRMPGGDLAVPMLIEINRLMTIDMQAWFERLDKLALERSKPRSMTIALSQLGGRTLTDCADVLYAPDTSLPDIERPVLSDLTRLVRSVYRLHELSLSGDKGIAQALRQSWNASVLLTEIDDAGHRYIETCARAKNPTAAGLLKILSTWRTTVVGFNVVDGILQRIAFLRTPHGETRLKAVPPLDENGEPKEKIEYDPNDPTKQIGTIEVGSYFRQCPVNVSLVLLRFWQHAIRDVVW
jgi:hypothetical protein